MKLNIYGLLVLVFETIITGTDEKRLPLLMKKLDALVLDAQKNGANSKTSREIFDHFL